MYRNRASLTCLLCLLLTSATFAQPDSLWSRTFGGSEGEYCYSVHQTATGGYVLAGGTTSYGSGDYDFWLVTTDTNGGSLWSRTFGGDTTDICLSMQLTVGGGYVLAGNTRSFGAGNGDFWLVKTDADGDSLWSRTFGGIDHESCKSVQQTSDGGYILAGTTTSFGAGNIDFWLVKTSANGDSLWSRTYGSSDNDYCSSVLQTTDDGYILAGESSSFGDGDYNVWLVKTNANGDSLWSRTIGGSANDMCTTVQQTTDGGYMLSGMTESFGAGTYDFWLVKTDANGDSLWSRTFGGSGWDRCFSAQQTTDSGYVLVGFSESFGSGESDIWLVKTGPDPTIDADDNFITYPSSYDLSVHPNPFNPSTTISYDLTRQTQITVTVYDLLGRQVAELVNRTMPAGSHRVDWDGTNHATGVYLINLRRDDFNLTKKALLIR